MPAQLATGVLVLALFCCASDKASAQLVDLSWDNDILFGTDGSYTNGVKLGWRSDETLSRDCPQCWSSLTASTLDRLPGIGGSLAMHAIGAEVRQAMITPKDISVATPQYNDTPYVGVLRGDISLFSRHANSATSYNLSFGVIGPALRRGKRSEGGSSTHQLHRTAGLGHPTRQRNTFWCRRCPR